MAKGCAENVVTKLYHEGYKRPMPIELKTYNPYNGYSIDNKVFAASTRCRRSCYHLTRHSITILLKIKATEERLSMSQTCDIFHFPRSNLLLSIA